MGGENAKFFKRENARKEERENARKGRKKKNKDKNIEDIKEKRKY
jgi:hypothetical protein